MNNLKLEQAIKFIPTRVRAIKDLDVFNLLESPNKTAQRNDRTWSYGVFAEKHYPNEWEQKVKDYNLLFNVPPLGKKAGESPDRLEKTIISSIRKANGKYAGKDNEDAPTELIGYDYSDYRKRTDIHKPEQLIEDLIFAGTLNFEFGQKGVGK